MKNKIEKKDHIEVGQQIKIVLGRCRVVSENQGYTTLGEIYTITDRPSKRSRKNGDKGVWVENGDEPMFVWFFEYRPYVEFHPMLRTKSPIRIKEIAMQRTVYKRTKF